MRRNKQISNKQYHTACQPRVGRGKQVGNSTITKVGGDRERLRRKRMGKRKGRGYQLEPRIGKQRELTDSLEVEDVE